MRIHLSRFDGELHALGIEVGSLLHDRFLEEAGRLTKHEGVAPQEVLSYVHGIQEATGLDEADILAMMENPPEHTDPGVLQVFLGNHLSATYSLREDDDLLVFYGLLDGKNFLAGSLFPQMPGALFGLNRSGIAWATRLTRDYSLTRGPRHLSLLNTTNAEWDRIRSIKALSDLVLASSAKPSLVTEQKECLKQVFSLPEKAARTSLNSTNDNSVLVYIDCDSMEGTIVRGAGAGEYTLNILMQ